MGRKLIKTKFPGVYYEQDNKTKVKTYIARIKIVGVIDTEQIVGYSNDSIRTNPTIAYEKRTELINKIKNGESIRAKEDPTLNKFFNEYMDKKEYGNTLSSRKIVTYKALYKKHFPDTIKRKKIKQVTKDDIQNIIDTMLKNKFKPSYIDTIKSCFNPVFKDALEKEIIKKNIISGLKFPEYDKNRYFSLDEMKAKALYQEILNIPDNQYRCMFLFLLRGRRANEVLSLQWQYIDIENRKYTIIDSQSKIKRTLTFVLDNELFEAIECLNVQKTGNVFVNPSTKKVPTKSDTL
ncbi:MAG: site-specific integrase [Campylobacterota bacterium]|nr:site-specific integrase [Campylobacterota bacterium]